VRDRLAADGLTVHVKLPGSVGQHLLVGLVPTPGRVFPNTLSGQRRSMNGFVDALRAGRTLDARDALRTQEPCEEIVRRL
jgi:hypothetical protein